MPFITAGGARHYYRLDGRDDWPVLFLSHSLGQDHGMWDLQMPDFLAHFRVLRYDIRGHGASDTRGSDATIELLARDALAIADGLGIERFAFCGLSLGGMIGQWLAANAPDRVTRLVLANTSPRFADPAVMETRRRKALEGGMAAIADTVMERFFSRETLSANPAQAASARRVLLATDPAGYAACCAAVRDMDHTGLLGRIAAPTLVIAGDRDVSTPWEGHGEVLARTIAGAQSVRLPAAHLSNLERPRSFTSAVLRFLTAGAARDGERVRRDMLGDEHVNRAIAGTTGFTRDFQELITRYAWGAVWARPGLDRRTRRLLVLGLTAALGRWEEFRLHVRTGLARELEPCDVEEVLLQTAVYAGMPAANTGFHIAAEEQTD